MEFKLHKGSCICLFCSLLYLNWQESRCSVARSCPTLCGPMDCNTPGFPVLHHLPELRLPCPSPSPRAYSNSCPLSPWCHPTISSSVVPFFSRLQSFPATGSFLMSQLFEPDGQSIGASLSASVLPMNIQDWFPLGWTGLTPCSPMDSQEASPTL